MKKLSLAVLLSIAGPAYAELPTVIDHSAYPPSAVPVSPVNTPSTNTLYEVMDRIGQLQAEVQQLTGKVDEQAYRIDELKKQQKTMYSDFDERLQSLENKATGSDQASAEVVATEGSDAKPADAAAPVTEPPATEPASAEKPASTEEPAAEPAPAPAPSETPAASQAPTPTPATVEASGAEKLAYQQAYNELRNGHTDQSIAQFNAYLSNYPAGIYANNAQYWLGEAYRVNQDNDAARKAFNDVIDKYPDGAKVPDALLKLGYLEIELKNPAKAREYLTRVTTDYPKSPAAQLAAKKLLKLGQAN